MWKVGSLPGIILQLLGKVGSLPAPSIPNWKTKNIQDQQRQLCQGHSAGVDGSFLGPETVGLDESAGTVSDRMFSG